METATLTPAMENPESTPLPAPTSDRDVQRATLRDLVALATDCAATENEIERKYRLEVEQETLRNDRAVKDIARKYGNLREQALAASKQAAAQVEAKFNATARQLKATDTDLRKKVAAKHGAMAQEVMKKQEQATWLADSILENEQNGAAADYKQARGLIEQHLSALDLMESDAAKLLATYGVRLPLTGPDAELVMPAAPAPEEAAQVYEENRLNADNLLTRIGSLALPKMFVGSTPILAIVVFCAIAAVLTQVVLKTQVPNWPKLGIAVGGTFVGTLLLGFILNSVAKKSVRAAYIPFHQSVENARQATAGELTFATNTRDKRLEDASKKRKDEVQATKEKYAPYLVQAAKKRDAAIEALTADYTKQFADIKVKRDQLAAESAAAQAAKIAEVKEQQEREVKKAAEVNAQRVQLNRRRYDEALAALSSRLNEGLAKLRVPDSNGDGIMPVSWDDPAWDNYVTPKKFPDAVRFGELTVDLRLMAEAGLAKRVVPKARSMDDPDELEVEEELVEEAPITRHLQMPPPFAVPTTLTYPRLGSLLIQADRDSRPQALRAMQMVMARLLTTLPAGRVRFTIIDPIGRGENFAGFMRLADHDDALIGGRIWTEQEQIEQRLADMTEHMETVIQKYLRNEYETIDAYNAQAGELAEPYRILVIADFPTGFEGEAAKRLASICTSGARCGVYTLIMQDLRQMLPVGSHLDEVERNSVNIISDGDQFVVKDEIFSLFPLRLDPPPPEGMFMKVLDKVGAGAKLAKRVELSFDTIAPTLAQTWTRSSAGELVVPVGRSGATKLQDLRIGKGVAQHTLIAGKTGSGKSTLLHAMVTNMALWYSPDEVEFYLVDFKKGVEFKTYAVHKLPHARAIAVESDREFGLSVLQRLDAELSRRGNLFRAAGTQDLTAYRVSPNSVRMPRTLLMIDEFQEFFSEDDRVAQDAGILIDRLVRQGRAFGMHVLLGSQTIGGSSGLARSTIGQMAIRIALMTSEADSQLILGDNNSAARLLSRPGEAIYNDGGGLTENNSPFQVAWLPDPKREEYLERIHNMAIQRGIEDRDPLIVFEGNMPADVMKNVPLTELIESKTYPLAPTATFAFLGDPVAIKEPSANIFRRQAGSNVLLVGQQDEASMALMCVSIVSLATQQPPGKAIFYILDGTPPDSSLVGNFEKVKAALPHEVKLVDYRLVAEAFNEIVAEIQRRQSSGDTDTASIYVFLYGLQRYRMLRKTEETFSFSATETEKVPEPDKQFITMLKEGPSFGIHVIMWADTPATMDRTLDRASLREFDNRILFQMSQNDSSNLIDSPAGNKLGQNRALVYSEEQGMLEKFRPYALPDQPWLDYVKGKLAAKRV